MNWISISRKIPLANKPFLGLRQSYEKLVPVIFCRRGTKNNPIYQGWYDLDRYDIKYWMVLPNIDVKEGE